MPKRRPPQQKTASIGLFVDDHDTLVKSCEQAIGASLQPTQKGLSLTPIAGRWGDRSLYTLTGPLATNAEEKFKYKVIPLVELNSRIYWLTVSLEFEWQQSSTYLISAGIFVFAGNANDEQKSPLIRAEWGCLPDDVTGPHAQPHWHIYPSQLNRSQQKQQDFEADPDVQAFSPESESGNLYIQDFGQVETVVENEGLEIEWERSERFHFAMAARWHEGEYSNQPLIIEQLPKWLSGCIKYTLAQFKYIYKNKKNPT